MRSETRNRNQRSEPHETAGWDVTFPRPHCPHRADCRYWPRDVGLRRFWAHYSSRAGTIREDAKSSPATPLRIAAASDLQVALPEVTNRFQTMTGIESSVTFGASGQLAEQIKQGAPFDIFLSANESFVRDLAAGGLIKSDSVRSLRTRITGAGGVPRVRRTGPVT